MVYYHPDHNPHGFITRGYSCLIEGAHSKGYMRVYCLLWSGTYLSLF